MPSTKALWLGSAIGALMAAGCAGAALRGASSQALASAEGAVPAGATVFEGECAGCHGKRGQGQGTTPAVMGQGALAKQSSHRAPFATAADLFAYVSREMPLPKNRAGTLSAEDYWAVTAFMLSAHGVRSPAGGLNESNAKDVRLP